MKYTAYQIKKWEADCMTSEGTWFPARSLNYTVESMWSRIKNAWGVLTGKYDALDWQDKPVPNAELRGRPLADGPA